MKKKRSIWSRLVGLLVIVAGAAVLVLPPLERKQSERKVRAMLLEVQAALQDYHVEEELYPKRMMSGSELVSLLVEDGFLDEGFLNPWTGKTYAEGGGEDLLRYKTDSLAETYELIVYFPDLEREQFRLDSTENQSLEE